MSPCFLNSWIAKKKYNLFLFIMQSNKREMLARTAAYGAFVTAQTRVFGAAGHLQTEE